MMEITFNNKEKITNGFNVHDALIANFEYQYNNRMICLDLDNSEWGYEVKIKFENVLYFEVQSCYFWGKGYNVFSWEQVDDKDIIDPLYQKIDNKQNYYMELISKQNTYFATKFIMNSGDEMLIYCEKIFVEEKRTHQ